MGAHPYIEASMHVKHPDSGSTTLNFVPHLGQVTVTTDIRIVVLLCLRSFSKLF